MNSCFSFPGECEETPAIVLLTPIDRSSLVAYTVKNDKLCHLDAIHDRHVSVHENEIEFLSQLMNFDSLLSILNCLIFDTEGIQQFLVDYTTNFVVINDKGGPRH